MSENRPRACDPCRLRKIRCNGGFPCEPCLKAEFECSFAKKPLKPGPKGPRAATSRRIKTQLKGIRLQGSLSPSLLDGQYFEQRKAFEAQSPTRGQNGIFEEVDIDVELLSHYLNVYHSKLYSVWPVVDRTALVSQLIQTPQDLEARAMACAICAATTAQLRIKMEDFSEPSRYMTLADRFAAEAERCRMMYDHREVLTMSGILISFFLHAFYSATKKHSSATILLREALTKSQIMGLDKGNEYSTLSFEEGRVRCKVFWLLFITERGHAIQHENLSVVLKNSIPLPRIEDEADPTIFMGFLSLVKLFVAVEGTLIGATEDADKAAVSTPEKFAQLQRQLQQGPSFDSQVNEVQTTDIRITQQWMRILVWQLSVRKVSMTSSGDDALSLSYPACVARDSMHFLSSVSLDSLIAHGPGMVLKLFEIANSLLDVINCVPAISNTPGNTMVEGPRDILHALSCLLSSLTSCNSRPLSLLQEKMAKSDVPFPQVPRSLAIPNIKDGSFDSRVILSPLSSTSEHAIKREDFNPSAIESCNPARSNCLSSATSNSSLTELDSLVFKDSRSRELTNE